MWSRSSVAFLAATMLSVTCTAFAQAPNEPATGKSQASPGIMQGLLAEQEAGRRSLSMSNLKQIVLAAMMYEMSHKSVPAAALVGKDGKTKHSWRVALLPYLEEQSLYDQYHFDEPWDSENNRKLVEKMPRVYRSPFADPKSTNASYFMPSGKGNIGDGSTGIKLPQIKDGTSDTIMFVEANRATPWTKPEDIEIDADASKPLPKFGFAQPSGEFSVAFADGSVKRVLESLDPKVLRAFFTTSGGEVIPDELRSQMVIGRKDPAPTPIAPPPALPKKRDLSKLTPAEREQENRKDSLDNLKTIGLSLLGYEDKHRVLPPRASFDKDGKPLLSWRVTILPIIGEESLYKQFHLDEPWDSEHNKNLLGKMPAFFRDPSQTTPAGMTVYQAVVGKGLCFEGDKGQKLAALLDGTSDTVAVVELAKENAVPWTKPADWEVDLSAPAKGLADVLPNHTFQCVFCDGHAMAFKKSLDPAELKKLFTRAGRESIGEWKYHDADR